MKKKDLIKHIVEGLEKSLPKNLEYNFPSINTSIGDNDIMFLAKGKTKVINQEFEIKIDFVGMFRKD